MLTVMIALAMMQAGAVLDETTINQPQWPCVAGGKCYQHKELSGGGAKQPASAERPASETRDDKSQRCGGTSGCKSKNKKPE